MKYLILCLLFCSCHFLGWEVGVSASAGEVNRVLPGPAPKATTQGETLWVAMRFGPKPTPQAIYVLPAPVVVADDDDEDDDDDDDDWTPPPGHEPHHDHVEFFGQKIPLFEDPRKNYALGALALMLAASVVLVRRYGVPFRGKKKGK